MIDWLVLCVAERESGELRRRMHIWCIGLDKESLGGDVAEDLSLAAFALGEEIRVEGKVRAEFGEAGDHFLRTAVGVDEEAALRERVSPQQLIESAPSLQAMDGNSPIQLRGESELWEEYFFLRLGIMTFNPAVEADLANPCVGMRFQLRAQLFEPMRRTRGDIPRMQAERRNDKCLLASERNDGVPIVFPCPVHHRTADGQSRKLTEDDRALRSQTRIVEMIMRVEILHNASCRSAKARMVARTLARPFNRVGESWRSKPRAVMISGSMHSTSAAEAPS